MSLLVNDSGVVLKGGQIVDPYHVDYTHLHTDGIITSTIDHFFVGRNILQICENGGVTHSVDNLSNHSIIYAVIQDFSSLNCEDDHGCETINSKTAWCEESENKLLENCYL